MTFDITEITQLLDEVAECNTQTMKLSVIEKHLDNEAFTYILQLYAKRLLKKPKYSYNKLQSVDPVKEIANYFNYGSLLPIPVLRIVTRLADDTIKVNRTTLLNFLQRKDKLINVYEYLKPSNDASIHSCKICGAGTEVDVCSYCMTQIEEFIDFQSSDAFSTRLTSDNYGRVPMLLNNYHVLEVGAYSVEYNNGVLTFNRRRKIVDAKLPFREYQKQLVA